LAGCPSCQADLQISQEQFGALFTCSNCQAVFFINWDGQPEVAQEGESSEGLPPEVNSFQNIETYPEQEVIENSQAGSFTEVSSFSESSISSEEDPFQEVGYPQESQPFADVTNFEVEEPNQSLERPSVDDQPLTPQQFVDEVIEFGNSTEVIEGLTYKVRILGIDSAESRSSLEDILREPRLNFDLQKLMQDILGGQLEIENLNTAKAFYLVQKLKQEAFDVSWSQNV
jgi:hypothetical protein